VVEVARKSADAAGSAEEAGKQATGGGEVVGQTVDGMKAIAEGYRVDALRAVATSAVREAANGQAFASAVEERTGYPLCILDGIEEARYIAKGAGCDPALSTYTDYRMLDLGGGSLEMIHFQKGEVIQTTSLPLGAVRITERFVQDPRGLVSLAEQQAIHDEVFFQIEEAGLDLANPELLLVAAGGGFNVAQRIWESSPDSYQMSPKQIPLSWIKQWRSSLCAITLDDRLRLPGIPPTRADIMPAAAQVMVSIALAARQDRFHHTAHNLRYGIAAETFAS